MTNKHSNAVKKFKKANAGWLTDDVAPMIALLEDMAIVLDEGNFSGNYASTYTTVFRQVKNAAPKGVDVSEDDSEELSQSDD